MKFIRCTAPIRYLHRFYKNILHSTYLGKNFNSIAQDFHTNVHCRVQIYHPSIMKGLQNKKNTSNNNQIYTVYISFLNKNKCKHLHINKTILAYDYSYTVHQEIMIAFSTRRLYKLISPSS